MYVESRNSTPTGATLRSPYSRGFADPARQLTENLFDYRADTWRSTIDIEVDSPIVRSFMYMYRCITKQMTRLYFKLVVSYVYVHVTFWDSREKQISVVPHNMYGVRHRSRGRLSLIFKN